MATERHVTARSGSLVCLHGRPDRHKPLAVSKVNARWPSGHERSMEIARLSKIYSAGGAPFVSVYVEAAAARTEITVKNIERELAGDGVDEATLGAVVAAPADRGTITDR